MQCCTSGLKFSKNLGLTRFFLFHLQTGDDSFVLSTIRTVFSSSDMLSISFRREPAVCSTTFDHGLDLDSIRKSYQLILALEPQVGCKLESFALPLTMDDPACFVKKPSCFIMDDPVPCFVNPFFGAFWRRAVWLTSSPRPAQDTFQTTLFNALEIIIAHLANTSVPTSGLALLLIVLEFPELNVPTYHESMVKGLSKIVRYGLTFPLPWYSHVVLVHFSSSPVTTQCKFIVSRPLPPTPSNPAQ